MMIPNIVKQYLNAFMEIKKTYRKIEKRAASIEKYYVFTEKTVRYIIHSNFADMIGFFIGKNQFSYQKFLFEPKIATNANSLNFAMRLFHFMIISTLRFDYLRNVIILNI